MSGVAVRSPRSIISCARLSRAGPLLTTHLRHSIHHSSIIMAVTNGINGHSQTNGFSTTPKSYALPESHRQMLDKSLIESDSEVAEIMVLLRRS